MAMAVAMGDARVQGRRRRRRRRRCQPPVRQIGACAGVRLLLCWRAAIGYTYYGYTYYGYTYYVPACGLDMRIERGGGGGACGVQSCMVIVHGTHTLRLSTA